MGLASSSPHIPRVSDVVYHMGPIARRRSEVDHDVDHDSPMSAVAPSNHLPHRHLATSNHPSTSSHLPLSSQAPMSWSYRSFPNSMSTHGPSSPISEFLVL